MDGCDRFANAAPPFVLEQNSFFLPGQEDEKSIERTRDGLTGGFWEGLTKLELVVWWTETNGVRL